MNILFLGDVVGKAGRRAVCQILPHLIHREKLAFVIVNCENAAGGAGVDEASCRALWEAGADVLTSGNHIWRHREVEELLDRDGVPLLRPANYPDGSPGRGWASFRTPDGCEIVVVNLIGRVFMDSVDCPFQAVERILGPIERAGRVIFVDMHCDATSEKGAMGWFLDGRVSAVIGSHTHVQTADNRLLPKGTAFMTDAGMCGPIDSVIGVRAELAIRRFVSKRPTRFEPASGRVVVQGAVVEVDAESGRAAEIRRIQEYVG